jgi:hypothetical protein
MRVIRPLLMEVEVALELNIAVKVLSKVGVTSSVYS